MATTRTTPARRRHNNQKENVYFEPGKQGRRTGLTLKDTGIRDEYGLEPVSGIFSSPVVEPSPQPSPQRNGNTELDSSDMVIAESSIPDITETLNLRKTPRLPPKTQTPRHTNIGGSPLRHSSVKPASQRHSPVRPLSEQPADRANRKLDFSKDAEPIRATTEKSPSPAKQRKTRKSLFSFEGFDSPVKRVPRTRSDSEDLDKTVQEAQHVLDTMVDDAMDSMADGETYLQPIEEAAMSESELDRARSPSANPPSSNQKRKREHLPPNNETADESGGKENDQPEPEQKRRKSDADLTQAHAAPEPTIVEETFAETTENEPEITEHTIAEPDATEYTVAEPTNIDHTVYTTADPTEHTVADQTEYTVADPTEYTVAEPSLADETVPDDAVADQTMADDTTAGNQTTLEQSAPQSARRVKTLSVHRDQETAQGGVEEDDDVSSAEEFIPPPDTDHEQEPEPEPTVQPKKRGRGRQPKQSKPRKTPHPPVERDPNSQVRASRDTDSADSEGGTKKKGPKSIVSLRAGTPAEDEGATTTRSGRTSIKPLKYWCNESFLWKNGEVEGIVRASEVPDGPKQPSRRPGRSKKKAGLGAIREDEEEEDEDLLPEAWEEELGVINGRVRAWDADMGVGNPDDEVHEDIAFASTSIATRDVQGSAFRYAKVMTMPFFGAGMVEVPPEGYKRMKNSRKMQMIFFVHEGRVTVDVGDIKFGISKGGVWQVPRGNNYAIYNESKRHTAKIFFSQGCELEAGVDEGGPA